MPDSIEENIRQVLDGLRLDDDEEICDYPLAQQNESIEAKGIKPASNSSYLPICQKTVTYIVAAVIINDKDEVLMIQEAKASCAGKWYLPAGRVEPNETLIDAVKREVLEETGLTMEPKSLIMVECASGSWFRFVMTGDVTGGTLKTPDQANEESLQASWVNNVDDLSLRSSDILPLIQRARDRKAGINPPWHLPLLPVEKSWNKLFIRLIVCIKRKATNRMHVLISEKSYLHLPICEINPSKNLHSTLHKFMVEIFGNEVAQHRPHGLLSVEYSGEQSGDGICFTILVSFRPALEEVTIIAVPGELADCQKLKELNLKGNKLNDKRLEKLIDQCRTKQILDYVNQHCEKSSKSKGSSGKENKGKSKKNTKNDGHNKNIDDDAIDNLTHKLKITHVSNESPVIKITESIKQVRPHIVGCIVRNISFNEENFKKFIQLQTKLHDGICDKRNAATIATHDYDLIVPGDLTFTAKAPTEIEIKPLGRTKLFTAAELFKRLQVEADNLRREKKRNVYSGIYKYLYLIEGKPLFPCLLDSANQVISFPPITNSDITKMSVNTKNMFIEVTGVTSQQICRNVMDEFLKELITQGLCSSTDSNQTSNAHNLEVEQVKVVDMEGNLKHIYPSRVDLNFDDKIKIIRD